MFSRQDLYEQMGLLEIVREYVAIVRESVKENVHYDSVATTVEQERAVNSVEPVMVRVAEGEQLIQKNAVVTEEMMKRVRAIAAYRPPLFITTGIRKNPLCPHHHPRDQSMRSHRCSSISNGDVSIRCFSWRE